MSNRVLSKHQMGRQLELVDEPKLTPAILDTEGANRMTLGLLDAVDHRIATQNLAMAHHPAAGRDVVDDANKKYAEVENYANAFRVQHPLPGMDLYGDRRDVKW